MGERSIGARIVAIGGEKARIFARFRPLTWVNAAAALAG